jgi:hypothetical protein
MAPSATILPSSSSTFGAASFACSKSERWRRTAGRTAFVGLGPEETADRILAELAEFDDPYWCGVWFVRPRLVGR